MKPVDIFTRVKPGTTIYQVTCGNLMEYSYKLTEVETGYYGERTYRIVLEDKGGSTWVDRSGQEWFLKKSDAIDYAVKRYENQIKELQRFIRKIKDIE